MPQGHSRSADGSITYGEAEVLFPVEELDASVSQYRDAELALDGVTDDDVISVSPTSLATGYALGRHPLTAISVESLPAAVASQIEDSLETSINAFEFIQVGTLHADSPNHSLAEFGDA